MANSKYHQPVLLRESIEGLHIKPEGIYADVTFGGGGHSRAILERLTRGKLIAFDQDPDAFTNAIEDEKFILIRQNFRYLKNFLKYYKLIPVDGLLADLGVSSHQFDIAERGFSTRFDATLDMRMDKSGTLTAKDVLNNYPSEDLLRIIKEYGEIKNAGKVVNAIIRKRTEKTIETVNELKEILAPYAQKKKENQFYAQVFQALRIEVNDELGALKELLTQCPKLIKKGGRLVVIAYHSLEDRLVKNFIKTGDFSGSMEKDIYGNIIRPFQPVNKKPITPSQEEIKQNKRARSAKLRIAEKL